MSQETLSRLSEEAKTLTLDELQELHVLLGERLAEERDDPEAKQRLLAQRLFDDGLLEHIPTRTTDDADHEQFIPIIVQGEPVSETVIKERR